MMFAADLCDTGAKSFHPWMISTVIDKLSSTRAPSLYEYLMTNEAQQFHVDIDYKNDRLGADALQAHALGMVEQARLAVKTAANERGLNAGEPLLFNSSTATKAMVTGPGGRLTRPRWASPTLRSSGGADAASN